MLLDKNLIKIRHRPSEVGLDKSVSHSFDSQNVYLTHLDTPDQFVECENEGLESGEEARELQLPIGKSENRHFTLRFIRYGLLVLDDFPANIFPLAHRT